MAVAVPRRRPREHLPPRAEDAIPEKMCIRCGMIHSPAVDAYDCIDNLRSLLAEHEQRRESPRKREA